jgi:hypothetical protein
MRIVRNSEVNLVLKGNFKRSTVCGEFRIFFDFFIFKREREVYNLRLMKFETQNRLSKWINIIDTHIFHVHLICTQSMIVVI